MLPALGRTEGIKRLGLHVVMAKGLRDVVMASGGTDGTEGPTDPDEAVVDGGTIYNESIAHATRYRCGQCWYR